MTRVLDPTRAVASVLDRLDLALLRYAKHHRGLYDADSTFYDTFFSARDELKYRKDVRDLWRYSVITAVYRDLFGSDAGEVVDMGCGLGLVSQAIPAARYTGVDISESTLLKAAELNEGVTFFRAGFPDLPVESSSTDLMILLEVLEHVPDDWVALREAARIVRPGGHLLVSVPSSFYWSEYLPLIGHFRHYAPIDFERQLADTGFVVRDRLRQFSRLWRAYHYGYVIVTAAETVLSRVAGRPLYAYNTRLYASVARLILRYAARHDRSTTVPSTFLLCRRVR